MTDSKVVALLEEAASENTMLARVLRHVQDKPVCPHPSDFYAALKHDRAVVVRLHGEMPGEREIPIDCRFRDGAVEFTTEFRDVGLTGRDQFIDDVRDATNVEVVHHRDSQFENDPDPAAKAIRADGGTTLPSMCDWPYEAVIHGADLRRDCLALTGSGKPCSYQAYAGEHLCSTHQSATDPDVVAVAHQWARISDGETTIAVCVKCKQVWRGGSPALAVDCPTCGREAGARCRIERNRSAGTNAPIPPHPERRVAGREVLDEYTVCSEAPEKAEFDVEQKALDGGRPEGQVTLDGGVSKESGN